MSEQFLMTPNQDEVTDRIDADPIPPEDVDPFWWFTQSAAPTQIRPVIIENMDRKQERLYMRWGFVPRWRRPDGKTGRVLIEARSETMFEKPTFRKLARFRRCVVPMSGYFEWLPAGRGKKQPYCIAADAGEKWHIAGLWDDTSIEGSDVFGSFVIVTMPANPKVARIHPRMPVILNHDHEEAWLAAAVTDARVIRRLVEPFPETNVRVFPVGTAVNNPRSIGSHRTAPVAEFTQCALWS